MKLLKKIKNFFIKSKEEVAKTTVTVRFPTIIDTQPTKIIISDGYFEIELANNDSVVGVICGDVEEKTFIVTYMDKAKASWYLVDSQTRERYRVDNFRRIDK